MILKNKQKGFTIVELLIVIVVIGILAAISIVVYNGVVQKAKDDQRIAAVRNAINASASYHAETVEWPTVAQLRAYQSVKLSGTAETRLTTSTPSATYPGRYRIFYCNNTTGSSAIAQRNATGIQITYRSEDEGAARAQSAGVGTRCAAPSPI